MITEDFETSQGKVTLRGLKRGEIKGLRKAGFDFGREIPVDKFEEQTEAVLKVVLPKEFMKKIDELEESEILRMHRSVIKLTYPAEEQAKN